MRKSCEVWENTETWSSVTVRKNRERKGMLCEVQGGDWATLLWGIFYPNLQSPVWQPSYAIHFVWVNLPHSFYSAAQTLLFFQVPIVLPWNNFRAKQKNIHYSSIFLCGSHVDKKNNERTKGGTAPYCVPSKMSLPLSFFIHLKMNRHNCPCGGSRLQNVCQKKTPNWICSF